MHGLLALLGLGLLIGTTSVQAQDTVRRITLAEAIDLFAKNNLELRLARTQAVAMTGLALQAASYPNPLATVTHEPLFGDGERVSETYAYVSQPFEWPGFRRARIDAAAGLVRSARARVQVDSLRLVYEVTRAYLEAAVAEAQHDNLLVVTRVVRQADRAAEAQYTSGEASGYDLRRLRVERARYEGRLAVAELETQRARRRLALLILPEEEAADVGPATRLSTPSFSIPLDTALAQAQTHRAEVVNARAEVAHARAALRLAQKERLPPPTLTAGYKRQSGGFKGLFLGVAAPLPLFDRNRGQIAAQGARLHAAETRLILTEQQVAYDVRRTYDAYVSLTARVALLSGDLLAGAEALLTTAQTSYAEGEMSLLELLDATEAYRDAQHTTLDLQAALQIAYYDLQRAAGGAAGF